MDIFQVPDDRRYWVVRAESGRFYEHFVKYGVIALGHLDCIEFKDTSEGERFYPDEEELTDQFKKYREGKKYKKQSTSVQLAQAKSFIYDMSIGDWVVTIGSNLIRFGRIISNSYIDNTPLIVVYDPESGHQSEMEFKVRREVSWGPSISKKELPYGLTQSLKSNLTVFNLDRHWQAVHHSLYPAFMKGGNLYLSSKIRSNDEIKNYSVSAILTLLNEVEVIGKEFAKNNNLNNFEAIYNQYIDDEQLTITTKAQFHSPGDIWNAISSIVGEADRWETYVVVAYGMLFGNQKLGFDGLLDLQTRQKLWDLVLQRLKKNKAEKVVESLQLEMPKTNTEKLEDSSKDK
ncbi:hypothetical protein [Pseudoalteromonas maricaloris]|uniref:hypothetical protein n=1 Tax=Pseudoalteromonas maricaloris TaxID=184924 RepID=UPI00057FDDB5|nr:hypothetical protein [Pseudoalteromonas flavipulchra]KID36205.1 hypothetical protein QT15_11335 [Pseudoalteromonas flavipulchra NCIMB 2033 = ATCC BAA-314]MBD0780375.1 hypothetical protein [Pseudoalteromonas flavipulchra]MBE0371647.1 hypothetical protein [Pseudoalteromonas flavipulchra NCIMB 2033 = ATCC BAA-314]